MKGYISGISCGEGGFLFIKLSLDCVGLALLTSSLAISKQEVFSTLLVGMFKK